MVKQRAGVGKQGRYKGGFKVLMVRLEINDHRVIDGGLP